MPKPGTATFPGQQTAEKPWENKQPIRQPLPPKQPQMEKTFSTFEKLLETDLYVLYGRNTERGWCYEPDQVWLKQVYKVGADFVLVNNDTYRERLEREILPILKARCNQLRRIYIFNYIKGVRIDYPSLKESPEVQEIPGGNEVPNNIDKGGSLSQTEVKIDHWGNRKYFMYGYESLLDLRTPRSEREGQSQVITNDEKVRDKWKKRADEAHARQRAAEEKLAATNMTADGQLNLSGIDNEHKRLFLMIYNGNFHDLSEREDVRDLPIMIYRGMIIQNDKLCHDFLSRNAVTVVETWDRLDDISRGLFGTVTKTYVREKFIITMEPHYRDTFIFSGNEYAAGLFGKFVSAVSENPKDSTENKRRWADAVVLEYRERAAKARAAIEILLPRKSCGSPGTVRFMDNMTRYVTSDYSKSRLPNNDNSYTEKIHVSGELSVERFYDNVLPTFSPDFPLPEDDEHIMMWINKNAGRQGLSSVSIQKLSFVHLTPDRTYTSIMIPTYVRQALHEKKYSIAECTYLVGPATAAGTAAERVFYWNANGPLPSESVRAFAKQNVSEPRTSCPVNVPSPK